MSLQRTMLGYAHRLLAAIAVGAIVTLSVGPARAAVTISVNWSDNIGSTSTSQFGTNDQVCGEPAEGANDSTFCGDMSAAGFRFIRLHSDIVDQWTTDDAWDETKVSTALNASYVEACGGANTLICINYVPTWCRAGNSSTGAINQSEYASFCASLVTMTNKTLGKGIHYWECMNEPDQWADYANYNFTPMYSLYNACATAMKAADPTIVVGGPTESWYWDWLNQNFLAACWSNVGFVSWHNYCPDVNASLSPYNAETVYDDVMSNIPSFATDVSDCNTDIANLEADGYSSHTILTDNDEYNIPNDYIYTGWGQQSNVGATYLTAALIANAKAGIGMAANWCDKDDTYGLWDLTDEDDAETLPAYVYGWANNILVGQIAASSSSDSDVQCLPVLSSTGYWGRYHFFLIYNSSYNSQTVHLEHGLSYPAEGQVDLLTSTGDAVSYPDITSSDPSWTMPAFSVMQVQMP